MRDAPEKPDAFDKARRRGATLRFCRNLRQNLRGEGRMAAFARRPHSSKIEAS